MKINFYALILIILVSGCGFKVIDSRIDFNIANIITTGDKKISYDLKNKLFLNSNENNKKKLKITIDTNKRKSIYERNIKNEITKYTIKIVSNVEVIDITNNLSKKFTVTNNGIYNVGLRHSATRTNENQLIKLLTDELLEKILDNLTTKFNDS